MDVDVNVLVVRHRALIFTVLVGWTPGLQLGRLKVLDLLILDFVEILPANLDRALLAEERDRSFHVAPETVDRKIYAPNGTIVEPQDRNTAVFELNRILMAIIIGECEGFTHVAHQPIEQIYKMAELRKECPAIFSQAALPVAFEIFLASVPIA